MNAPVSKRHPFLDDLADDVTLMSSILRHQVEGRDLVTKAVKAGGSMYINQTPLFLGTIEGRTFFEYEVTLTDGQKTRGLVAIGRNEAGEVSNLNITFSPLGSVLAIAAGVRPLLADDLGTDTLL